jgi:GT2 family glycosyltransferase
MPWHVEDSMHVSLIIVTEADTFQHKQSDFFASIAGQTYPHPRFELIIVDGNQRRVTADAVKDFQLRHPAISTQYLTCASNARGSGNNLGAAHASGELLIFLADDFDPAPDFIAAHVDYHLFNPDIHATGIGPGYFPDSLRLDLFARWQEDSGLIFGTAMRQPMVSWPDHFFYAGNASIKRAKFRSIGGFDDAFRHDAWDDYEFGLRWAASGGYSQFIAGAITTHRHAVSLDERCHTMTRAGQAAHVLEALHPKIARPWKAKLKQSDTIIPPPEMGAPAHRWIPYYTQRLDLAFRDGYLAG